MADLPSSLVLSPVSPPFLHMRSAPPGPQLAAGDFAKSAYEGEVGGAPAVKMAPAPAPAPAAAADPWKQYTDEASGRPFFYNAETKETSWTHP